ncbi:hypothetical protein ABK040_004499 [Willaertia magna]
MEISQQERETMKLVILGGGAVGKSSITVQYVKGQFKEKYDPTVEDAYTTQKVIDNQSVHISILDTAGQEEFQCLRDTYMRTGEGFVLVFSLIDFSSYEEIKDIYHQLLRSRDVEDDGIAVVLIGNKCDLKEERVIDRRVIDDWVNEQMKMKYIETSAKENINIESSFEEIVRMIRLERKGLLATYLGNYLVQQHQEEKEVEEEEKKKKKKKNENKKVGGGLFSSSSAREDQESDLAAFEGK